MGKPECSCNQAEWIKRTGGPCPCWERLLGPKEQSGHKIQKASDRQLDHAAHAPSPEDLLIAQQERESLELTDQDEVPTDDEAKLLAKLQDGGLAQKKAQVIVDRLITGMTFQEIAQARGYASRDSARMAFNEALENAKRKLGDIWQRKNLVPKS